MVQTKLPEENKGRNTLCNILLGAQKTGKSTFVKQCAAEYPKKVLVVCPDDFEPVWHSYKLIKREDIPNLGKGKFRVIWDPKDHQFLSTVTDHYKNGMLIWDDAKVYFNKPKRIFELESMLIRRRQFNIDVFFMYHGFSTIAPLLYTYATHLTLFRTNDAFQRAANKTWDYEKMMQFRERVQKGAMENQYYHEIILLQ